MYTGECVLLCQIRRSLGYTTKAGGQRARRPEALAPRGGNCRVVAQSPRESGWGGGHKPETP